MTDRETIDVYNAKATEYLGFMPEAPDATLTAFMARLPKGARVLDMGCGPGTTSAFLAEAGHRPDPVDPSDAFIEIAQSRYDLPARLGTFDDLNGPYDGVWANFSLLHMPRDAVPAYFIRLWQETTPGALLHLGLKTGTSMERDGIGRLYSYFTDAEICVWLESAGFAPEAPLHGQERGLAGTIDPFFTLTATRRD